MLSDFQKRKLAKQFHLLDVNKDGVITQADFEKVFQELVAARGWTSDSPRYTALREAYMASWEQLKQSADQNHDGQITLADFGKVVLAHGDSEADAVKTFAKLDLNGDGVISPAELRQLVREFYTSDDPEAPGNWLYGEF